jgi:group I intron endonuclease
VHVEKRKQQHFRALQLRSHHAKNLQLAADKYGINAFKFTIHQTCEKSELLILEQQYLDLHKPKYNSSLNAYSPLKDSRIRQKHKAAVNTPEYKQRMREIGLQSNSKTRIHTKEAKEKAKNTKQTAQYRKDASKKAIARNTYLQLKTAEAVAKHKKVMASSEYKKKRSEALTYLKKPVIDVASRVQYESTHAAAKATSAEHSNISRAARTGIKAAGRYWVFATVDIVI